MRRIVAVALLLSFACAGGTPEDPPAPPAPEAPEVLAPARSVPVARVRPVFPLTVGDRWTWTVTRHVGAGLRVLFIPTEPASADVVATWVLTIDRALPEGRFAATLTRSTPGNLPNTTALTFWTQEEDLWMLGVDGPQRALDLTVPPDAVATEKVPCVAHFLDHLPGVCSPAPGGPLGVPPGPTFGLVHADGDDGRTLTQVLVGLGTAGLFIPGNKTASEYAELTGWVTGTPTVPSPVVERFRAHPKAPLPDGLDREEAAAVIVLAEDRTAVAGLVMPRVPQADRPSLLRVVLDAEDDASARLGLLATLLPALGGPPTAERVAAVAACVPEEDEAGARALLEGRWPVLRASLLDPGDAALRTVAATAPPSVEESFAVFRRSTTPPSTLAVLLAATPAAGQIELLRLALAHTTFDDDRLALIEGQDAVFAAHADDVAGLAALLEAFSFDDARVPVATRMLTAVPAERRRRLLLAAIVGMHSDAGRLQLIDAWSADARSLSDADKDTILATFVFERELGAARLGR